MHFGFRTETLDRAETVDAILKGFFGVAVEDGNELGCECVAEDDGGGAGAA